MSLSRTQAEFAQDVARLLQWAYQQGYRVTLGDAYRDPRSHGKMGTKKAYGRARSAHKQRLAIDLNLFRRRGGRWRYVTSSAAHAPLGTYWKSLHPDNAWGGDFTSPDGNHYSRSWRGIS